MSSHNLCESFYFVPAFFIGQRIYIYIYIYIWTLITLAVHFLDLHCLLSQKFLEEGMQFFLFFLLFEKDFAMCILKELIK